MAQLQSINPERNVKAVLDPEWIWEKAVEWGVVRRVRRIDVVAFVCTIILGFGGQRERSLAGLRRAYAVATGVHVVASAFYKRFSYGMYCLIRGIVERGMELDMRPRSKMIGVFSRFKDLLIADATVVHLHALLKRPFPACRTNVHKAAAKLHFVMSVKACGPRSVRLTSERAHENRILTIGRWVKGRLMIFDLGYYDHKIFARIHDEGGYFVSRLKDCANPLITGVNSGCSIDPKEIGQQFKHAVREMKGEPFDVEIKAKLHHPVYDEWRSSTVRARHFRIIGLYDETAKRYRFYMTNVPPDRLSPKDIATVYEARWEIELLFKELKSYMYLKDIPTTNKNIARTLLYASIAACLVSRALMAAIYTEWNRHGSERIRTRRFASIFSTIAGFILQATTEKGKMAAVLWNRIEHLLLWEALDPNVNRCLNLDRFCE